MSLQSLGITRILIHRYSSILSAYGLNLAERFVNGESSSAIILTHSYSVYETQEPSSYVFGEESLPTISRQLDKLSDVVEKELGRQGFPRERIDLDRRLNMRFDGTDTALLISSSGKDSDFEKEFKTAYQQEFGFLLQSRVMVDDINVRRNPCDFDVKRD